MDSQTENHQPPIISDQVIINKTLQSLILTGDGILRWNDRSLNVEKDVLGLSVNGNKMSVKAVVERKEIICCGGCNGDMVRNDFVFEFLSDDSLKLWCLNLRQHIDTLGRPKRLFVIVNPYGGKKSAFKIFVSEVKPLLEDADIEFTLHVTEHQLHAKEVAYNLDLSKYDGVVCVSGDGILVEVINGLLERGDWRDAIKLPVGMVPAGTGNGMVKSLLDSVGHRCTVFNAVHAIIRGHKRSLDVATILQGKTRFFSVLMVAWGLVADIDIESEKYRWMGSARLDLYGLQRVLSLRYYNGRISFVPAPGFENYGEPTSYSVDSTSEQNVGNPNEALPVKVQERGYKGPETELTSLDWRRVNGPFVSIWLHNVPWGSEDTMAAPDAKFSDGFLDLILIKECPKLPLLKLMGDMNNGRHVKSPYVMYLKVRAFILEPGRRTDDPTKEGIIDSDGEVLAWGKGTYKCEQKTLMSYNKLQITMEQGLATLFAPS